MVKLRSNWIKSGPEMLPVDDPTSRIGRFTWIFKTLIPMHSYEKRKKKKKAFKLFFKTLT